MAGLEHGRHKISSFPNEAKKEKKETIKSLSFLSVSYLQCVSLPLPGSTVRYFFFFGRHGTNLVPLYCWVWELRRDACE
jgi:hypothetical protein